MKKLNFVLTTFAAVTLSTAVSADIIIAPTECPKNATCAGGKIVCNEGFELKNSQCVSKYGYGDGRLCPTNNYVSPDGICKECPKNATCDGAKLTCNEGFVLKNSQCVSEYGYDGGTVFCPKKDQYLTTNGTCRECPEGGVCDGKTVTCQCGKETINSDRSISCPTDCLNVAGCAKNEYLNRYTKNCLPCPDGATCDGTTAKCKEGYETHNMSDGTTFCLWIGCVDTAKGNSKDQGCTADKPICVPDSELGVVHPLNKCVKCLDDQPYGANAADTGCTTARPVCVQGAKFSDLWRNEGSMKEGTHCMECVTDNYCTRKYGTKKPVCNQNTYTCGCKENQYLVGSVCTACPKGAKCDGQNASCPYGYKKDAKSNVICNAAPRCSATQYLANNKCTTCPKNATCNGKTATCKKGYNTTTTKTGVVICSHKKCQQGSHESHAWIKKRYKNCTNCRVESIKAGACSKNKKAHKHYYCDCDC